jgi:hypothetical protein
MRERDARIGKQKRPCKRETHTDKRQEIDPRSAAAIAIVALHFPTLATVHPHGHEEKYEIANPEDRRPRWMFEIEIMRRVHAPPDTFSPKPSATAHGSP